MRKRNLIEQKPGHEAAIVAAAITVPATTATVDIATPITVATVVAVKPTTVATLAVGVGKYERPHTSQRIWNIGLAIAIIAGLVLIATAVMAQDVEVPIDTVYRGRPGTIVPVATIPAEPGLDCAAILESRNNDSVHPNSDILVGPIAFTDVESGSFQAAGLTFVSTGPINVAVRIGGDAVFSAGFTLEVTCNPPTTTTSTAEPPTATTTTTTTPSPTTTAPPATTTTTPPPVGGVPTGGGACADGTCESSLSPLATWIWLAILLPAGGVLVWSFFRYVLIGDGE